MISSNLISNYKFTRMLFENWVEIINWKRKSSSLYRLIRLWLYDWFILTPVKFANRCPTTREFSEDFEIFFVNSFWFTYMINIIWFTYMINIIWFTYMINIRKTRTRKRSARKSSVFSPFMKKLKSSLLKKNKKFSSREWPAMYGAWSENAVS